MNRELFELSNISNCFNDVFDNTNKESNVNSQSGRMEISIVKSLKTTAHWSELIHLIFILQHTRLPENERTNCQ